MSPAEEGGPSLSYVALSTRGLLPTIQAWPREGLKGKLSAAMLLAHVGRDRDENLTVTPAQVLNGLFPAPRPQVSLKDPLRQCHRSQQATATPPVRIQRDLRGAPSLL